MAARTRNGILLNPLTKPSTAPPALESSHITSATLAASLTYDYNRIDNPEDREAIRTAATKIKPRLKRVARDILDTGAELNAIRERVPHGQWAGWLETEFELSETIARNWMNAAERFGNKSANFADLPLSAIYQLSAPSTPAAAIAIVEQRLIARQPVTVQEVKKIVTEAKPKPVTRTVESTATIPAHTADNDEPDDDDANEWQRLHAAHAALSTAHVAIEKHLQTFNDYYFGQEASQLMTSIYLLREKIAQLTPKDRLQ